VYRNGIKMTGSSKNKKHKYIIFQRLKSEFYYLLYTLLKKNIVYFETRINYVLENKKFILLFFLWIC